MLKVTGIPEDKSHVILEHTYKLFLRLPKKLQADYPLGKSGRFIDVYDFHKKFFTDLDSGKISLDDIGDDAKTLLQSVSTFKRRPADYGQRLELEFKADEIILFRDIIRRKRNTLRQQNRFDQADVLEKMLGDFDNAVIQTGYDTFKRQGADGNILLKGMEDTNKIWQDKATRYSTKHKGKSRFEDNSKSKVLKALENGDYDRLQDLVIGIFGNSTYQNNVLLDTLEGQALVKIYGGVRGEDGLYYPTEETAEQLRIILKSAY